MRWWLSLASLWTGFLLLLLFLGFHYHWSCDGPPTARLWPATPLSDYWTARSRLLTADQLLETGGTVVLHGAERKVNDLLTALKRQEFEATPFAAVRHFMNAREDIRRSKVFELIRMVPKGEERARKGIYSFPFREFLRSV